MARNCYSCSYRLKILFLKVLNFKKLRLVLKLFLKYFRAKNSQFEIYHSDVLEKTVILVQTCQVQTLELHFLYDYQLF